MALLNLGYNLNKVIENIYALVESRNYDPAKKILLSLHYADIADLLDQMFTDNDTEEFLSFVIPNIPANTLSALNYYSLIKIFPILGMKSFVNLLNQINLSDAVEIVGKFHIQQREEILSCCSEDRRSAIAQGLSYLYDTVGRVMEYNLIAVMSTWSAEHTIEHLKKNISHIPHNLNSIIIVNSKYKPIKAINCYTIINANKDEIISHLPSQELKIVDTNTKLEDISYLFKQYKLDLIAVANKMGKLVGIVPAANMISIIEEKHEEYILQLSGVKDTDDAFASTMGTVKHRFPWLSINLIMSFLTAIIINYFSATIAQKVALAAVIPIVASLSSNAATQVMTVTVRAIATNQHRLANFVTRTIHKEISVAFINSLGLTTLGVVFVLASYKELKLTLAFGLAIMVNFVFFSVLGCLIPLTLHRFKIDPAVPSNAILGYLSDFISYLSFLIIAYYIFN
jgi:magnesium transporter